MGSQKRELQKKKREKAIRKANAKKSIRNVAIGVAGLLVLAMVGYAIYYNVVLMTKADDNYSAGLLDDGTIENVVVADYVELCNHELIETMYSQVAPTDEELDAQIDTVLENYKEYSTEAGTKVALYDSINLDYVGKIDGVAFDGGSTSEGGTVITVGEAGYIDDFEDQLVGKEVGSSFDIEVTFPDDYGNPEVAGKDAVFSITINGIYIKSEFNDEFVKENLSDVALTAEAYRDYLETESVKEELKTYVENYVMERCIVKDYPDEYCEAVMGTIKFADEQEMEYMNQYYAMYFGSGLYDSLADYKGVDSELDYEAALRIRAQEEVAKDMVIQAIFEDAGLTVTSEHIDTVLAGMGGSTDTMTQMEEIYGKGYIYQLAMKEAVLEYLMGNVVYLDSVMES